MVDYMCASTDRDRHNLPPRPDWTVPTMPTSALSSTTTSGPKSDSTQFLVLSCHVLSRTFRLFLSIHCKNPPTCSKQQVPIAKVRFRDWFAYQIVSKHGPWATVTAHMLSQSTSLTMIRYSISFISIDRSRSTHTTMNMPASLEGGRNGCMNDGGTNSPTFANDGGTSYLGPRPTWVFASSLRLARPLQICWHIHLTFHSSLITPVETTSLQRMKRRYSLLSSSVIASAASALRCSFQVYRR